MYMLVKTMVDHENETIVSMQAASESLPELQQYMRGQYEYEMKFPSVEWLEESGWDKEFCVIGEWHAECGVETCEWSVIWHIFDTDNMDWFSFI